MTRLPIGLSTPYRKRPAPAIKAREIFEKLYGDFGLKPTDAAWLVFLSGWNGALEQAAKEYEQMPFGDSAASVAVFLRDKRE